MFLEPLLSTIAQSLKKTIALSKTPISIEHLALRRSARLPVLAAIYRANPRPIFLLTDRADHAINLYDELKLWLPDVPRLYFPEPNPLFYENAPWGETTRRERLSVLTALAAYHIPGMRPQTEQVKKDKGKTTQPTPGNAPPPIIVAPLRAIMSRTMPRRDFLKAVKTLKVEQIVQPEELTRLWTGLGYEAVHIVTTTGQFSRRGGILDVWPPAEPHPIRIEFFGDEIDTLRRFDPASQRTTASLEKIMITPAREYILESGQEIQAISNLTPGSISEFHIPILHPTPASAIEYLPRQSLILIDDHQHLADMSTEIEEQALQTRQDLLNNDLSLHNNMIEDFPIPYLTWSELEDILPAERTLELGGPVFDQETEGAEPTTAPSITQQFIACTRFAGRLREAMEYLVKTVSDEEAIFIVSRQSARLQELWQEQSPQHIKDTVHLHFLEGSLTEGFTFTPEKGQSLHLLTDGELFGWRRPEARRRALLAAESPEAAYEDLQPGDWVVHVDHGIGKFIGLVRRSVEGVEREYLAIEYADETQLFVPVYQADHITRYIGPDSRDPRASRLGSTEWKNNKAKAKEAAEAVARELLELYATRQVVRGHSFAIDTPWQQELEASFPYIETPDQRRVLGEVKQDMEAARPMDRLLCGDVGYGKTEVALRAAFKAVMDGKQVAVLVPTTVLAQQHYHTFRERLSAFPATVEMLSRFRTTQQQREILLNLMKGSVDIVIGTHRLISGDVLFKDLGLLIIDEEQRFGVTHKEKLKRLRTEVDVLTLTATPIPRTLYMALTGVRDISTLNTPPEERLPIATHVGPYNPKIIRQAIIREMERGGQIYFVHNRVQTIESMATHLRKIVPEAKTTIGHGQLDENTLADRMDAFSAGEYDILLCTTIIESGLDIPNCNTLIVNRADTFGLAQLYQLRGRVGRGAQRAYAYFFRHNKIPPTSEGRQRLETIAENTQLGAGFSIAMRDLEIRGAGEILGTRQSGYIAEVGFHLYTRLLADAVRRLRKIEHQRSKDEDLHPDHRVPAFDYRLALPVNVDLPLPVGLPISYIPDQETRLRLYRRIADIRTLPEIDAMAEEFNDRFGPLPEEAYNLLYQIRLKLLAEKSGLAKISNESGQLVLRYPPLPQDIQQRDLTGLPDLSELSVRHGKNALWMPLTENWRTELLEVLEKIAWKE